ncbi:hypothetical protein [uncultured Nostoc sp.]|uniref:hypothetical protein n=1 Tax=uncultured Nostoc sp. TaxID=340711 RepID=UPI002626A5AD|nr:hypothetical protein [uncultured Nostoc sp.]
MTLVRASRRQDSLFASLSVSPEASAQTSLLIPLIFTFTLVIQTVLIPHFQNLRGDRSFTKCDRPTTDISFLYWLPNYRTDI